jgi:hypothetical protein
MAENSTLTDPALTIIFATSPTGLGHLRVTDALYHGLPKGTEPALLGAQDPSVSAMYRFVSIHPITRMIMELVQMPPMDKPYAFGARLLIRSQTKLLYQQLKTILNERLPAPKKVLLVATHTTLGHQLGAIKKKLETEMDIHIILIVQVTDDSPQPLWYVHDADAIFVPSNYTREKLIAYAKKTKLPEVPIIVSAYPISPGLTDALSEHELKERLTQVDRSQTMQTHVSLPISGAAVGMGYSSDYITSLHRLSERFFFHITSREAAYTAPFIQSMSPLPYVKLYTSLHDMTTVRNYEQVFKETIIALEITKPSEQAFKALATPKQRGGAILLFIDPVGGQEYDNLHFLRNHGLMPCKHESIELWHLAQNQEQLPSHFIQKAHQWRALRLPLKPKEAAQFTQWALEQKLFFAMMHYAKEQDGVETKSNGVGQFWQHVVEILGKKN